MVEDTAAHSVPVTTLEEPSGERSPRDAQKTVDAERREAQLKARLVQEEERLEKLWDAYVAQERELRAAKAAAAEAATTLQAKEGLVATIEKALHDRDAELARANAANAALVARVEALEAQREELNALAALKERLAAAEAGHAAEKERLAKLFIVYEELAEENQQLALKLKERDLWIRDNAALFDAVHATRGERPATPEEGERGAQ